MRLKFVMLEEVYYSIKEKMIMEKRGYHFLALVVLFTIVLMAAGSVSADATSGKCGDNIVWELKNGTLKLTGTGPMYDYGVVDGETVDAPWAGQSYTSLIVSDGITSLGNWAFDGNHYTPGETGWVKFANKLNSIQLPGSLKNIGEYCFALNEYLVKVVLPDSVTTIGDGAFDQCKKLEQIHLSNSLEGMNDAIFFSCTNLLDVNIPESVSYIGYNAFARCENFPASIKIPKNVRRIDNLAFQGCSKLRNVYFYGDLCELEKGTFWADDSNNSKGQIDMYGYYPKGNATWTEYINSEEAQGFGGLDYTYTGSGKPQMVMHWREWDPSVEGYPGDNTPTQTQITPSQTTPTQTTATLVNATIKASKTTVKKGKKTTVKITANSGGKLKVKAKSKNADNKKYVKIKNNKITFLKKAPKGKYKFTVVSAANGNYKETKKTISIRVK